MEARSWAPRRQPCPPGIGLLALASLLSCLLTSSQAKVYSRCELARVLKDFGLEGYRGYSLADWICLAYFTSGFNTAAVDHEADGSTNNGIFQISSRKWCKNFTPNVPNQCQMYCSGTIPWLRHLIHTTFRGRGYRHGSTTPEVFTENTLSFTEDK
ncbi:Sperm acrosome membrane-associated protein 3 [Pteropus alecto]|uniref:Sperm acrosome membrane-associated protein 3 n=1 Tax=Pteropus alecto TaxID=9402 RepID=L5JU28_PTEAL|nr:Sperm acrosome membrane-associated protein 3 [Pteropus alecto]